MAPETESVRPSAVRTLNYALVTFLVALLAMVLVYQSATGSWAS